MTDELVDRVSTAAAAVLVTLLAVALAVLAVWQRTGGVQPHEVAPTEVKALATGKGNARKDAVMEAAVARWGDNANDPDIADAAWVAEHCRRFMHEKFSEGA